MYRDYTNIPVDFIDEITAERVVQFIKELKPDCFVPSNLFYLRRRIAIAMAGLNLSKDALESKISEKKYEFADQITYFISSDHSELFRDAETWTLLSEFLCSYKEEGTASILLPMMVRGEELFSLLILLSKLKLSDKYSVYVDSPSQWALGKMLHGEMSHFKMRSSVMNLKNVFSDADISDYTYTKNGMLRINQKLLDNVLTEHGSNNKYDIIICRNKTLNLNESDTNAVHLNLFQKLNLNGLYFLGSGERICDKLHSDCKVISASENIYQKIR